MLLFINGTIYKEFSMKNIPLKALTCALLTTTLFLNADQAFAEPAAKNETVVMQQVVHLNKSTIDDLVTLKGIGHKKAQAILTYRKQVGPFKSLQELTKVKGIGDKVLLDNKERLKI
jgi:competence protein ComEA